MSVLGWESKRRTACGLLMIQIMVELRGLIGKEMKDTRENQTQRWFGKIAGTALGMT